ncbi:MAG: 2-C-methyl-D-erythritol 4-phosphate cytidylyltransferase [Clostridia bacterium]|nr:2-C-methyl-D-erythritol 4-phosphate cytidylyltransferase [Clostridia bacterium]
MVFGIVLAGGKGSRMGNTDMPKQFMKLGSKPILMHTVEKFFVNPKIEKIIVPTHKSWVEHAKNLVEKNFGKTDRVVVIDGGESRNDTIMNAIAYIEENHGLDDDTIVVTHDSVRPFVTHRIIDENIECAVKYGACDTMVPAADTIVESVDGKAISSIPVRDHMYQGQTPHSFKAKLIKEIFEYLTEDEKNILTDACKMYVLKGEHVHVLMGEVFNIKITYPFDMKVAQSLIGEEEK